jgi:nucleotide-binding universal stress UspA family protein
MRVVIWIAEETWVQCVDQARAFLAEPAEVTLVHVAARDVEDLVGMGPAGLLGRRPPRHPPRGPRVSEVSAEEAEALLEAAHARLGRPARLAARRGRVEHEVLEATRDADLLVLARDGAPGAGPRSLGPRSRFVVDHAACPVLLLPAPLPSPGP